MPIREHITSQSYIDWLKSIGCLVYLPLSEDGDLQDRISGLSLQLTGNGSLVWDNVQQRYKLTSPNANQRYVGIITNGLSKLNFPDNKITILQRIKKITSSTSKNLRAFGANVTYDWDTFDVFNALWNGTSKSSSWPSAECSIGTVLNGTIDRSGYGNGVQQYNVAPYNNYLPSNWVLDGTGVIFGATSRSSSFTGIQLYISELYLFNTALDLQTIRQIQGYE